MKVTRVEQPPTPPMVDINITLTEEGARCLREALALLRRVAHPSCVQSNQELFAYAFRLRAKLADVLQR